MHKRLYIRLAAGLACLLGGIGSGLPAAAWTPATQVTIAREAARLSPPDLARQLEKHKRAFEEGVNAPFSDTDASRHMKNPDGSGQLDRVLEAETAAAVEAIRAHKPFEEIVRRLGVVSHYVADANNPLAASADDPEEGRYFVDYLRYAETAEPRFPLVFYGLQPGLDGGRSLSPLTAAALKRGRELYPLIGREYRRIDFASGIGALRRPLHRLRGGLGRLQPRGDRRHPGPAVYLADGGRHRRPRQSAGRRDAPDAPAASRRPLELLQPENSPRAAPDRPG